MNPPMYPLSPRLASTTAKFRNRVPTQLRRVIIIYIICACVLLIILNIDLVPSMPNYSGVLKRDTTPRKAADSKALGGFPRKIWQTWKIDPFSFEERDSTTAKTWTTRNPGFRYEVLTDSNDMNYVEEQFGPSGFNREDIIDLYRSVNATIIKADLLRYLIMYAEGGVYADIDVEALRPVQRFIPERYKISEVDMVLGVEIDQPEFKDHKILGKKSQSFCQWTFMAKPRLPVMLKLIENIKGWLTEIANKQKVPIGEVVLDFDEVISGTGPSAFTAAVLEEMNKRSGSVSITWDDFHDLDESKIISGILVLDVEAFAAGQGHSDSGNHNSRGALVKHHYHASNWPSRHPRFNHPVYGEVERCNWNADCVRKWDEDVEAFELLPLEVQQEKIKEKRAQDSQLVLNTNSQLELREPNPIPVSQ
ncbi:glycosyltransferase family 32 protein [Annulohypoxylon maeteangense]|uniref:glycosyltransferase family 32 protein n=1 Tax=Annulohypoxylon maeteangense TaxID=1927788 RepID=UPI002007EDFB|nr:glycosyltransferase family 32 protein [Annulohypoxylon maeteangense]KAI0879892.1 glycosyltransferase family 32 protein [Annulohypoxylon maeteangense]